MRRRAKIVPTIFILILLSFCLPCVRGSNSYTDVNVSEAKNMTECDPLLVILDVRIQSEYNSGHIRNAKLIPYTELENRMNELDKNRDTLVYCRSGYRSGIASEILTNHSFQKVYNMRGGILAWKDAGYPVYVRYASIQQAINNADEGDSIFVSSGTYHNHIVVNKTVSLIGENPETTVIDGNKAQNILNITAHNVNITKFTVQNGNKAFYLSSSSGSSIIADSNIIDNSYGVFVESDNNLLTGNNIVNSNVAGIEIFASCGCSPVRANTVTENKLLNNSCGIQLTHSVDSLVCHNNFVNNTQQVFTYSSQNTWDDGYPSGGNYWSDYKERYPDAEELDNSGIWNTPYKIDENNQDNYPLMDPWSPPKDTTPPTITVLSPENKTYTTTSVPLVSTLDECASWIGYSVDGEANETVSGNMTFNLLHEELVWINTTLKSLSEGPHWITIYANDTTGNMGSAHTVYFTIDTNPPNITTPNRVPEVEVEPNQEVIVSVNVTDEVSEVDTVVLSYATDNGTSWSNVTMMYNSSTEVYEAVIPEQPAEIRIKYEITAYDKAGNFDVNDNAGQYYVYTVIPEFPSAIILLLFMVATLITVVPIKYSKKERRKHMVPEHSV